MVMNIAVAIEETVRVGLVNWQRGGRFRPVWSFLVRSFLGFLEERLVMGLVLKGKRQQNGIPDFSTGSLS